MKKYDVTLTVHYQKTVSVYAESPEQAKEKTKIILFDTDLINFTDDDFVCGEADITEQSEDGLDGAGENTLQENEDCSDCPYFCPVCGECNLYVYRQGKTHIVSVIHEIYGSISYVVPAAHHTVKINGIRNWTEKPLTVINATISLTTELNGKELKSV